MLSKPQIKFTELKKKGLDPVTGFLFPEFYQPDLFNKNILLNSFKNLPQKLQKKQVQKILLEMPCIELKLDNPQIEDFKIRRDCLYLHGILTTILNAFLTEKRQAGVKQSDIVVPKNIGLALYEVSNFLKIKYGMCGQFYCNWRLKNQPHNCHQLPQNFKITDVEMILKFTEDDDQNLFLGGSVLGSFYLFKSFCSLFLLKKQIQQKPLQCQTTAISTLKSVEQNLKRINESNTYLLTNMKQGFLYLKLRKYLGGFKEIKFQGIEQRLSSDGGAGGFDPLYQIFQKMIGVQYIKGPLTKTQEIFRSGFPEQINQFIKQFTQNPSYIKEYCSEMPTVKIYYNRVIDEYKCFYDIHQQFIKKFVKLNAPQSTTGVGGVKLQDIQKRADAIQTHKIKR